MFEISPCIRIGKTGTISHLLLPISIIGYIVDVVIICARVKHFCLLSVILISVLFTIIAYGVCHVKSEKTHQLVWQYKNEKLNKKKNCGKRSKSLLWIVTTTYMTISITTFNEDIHTVVV